MFFYGAPDAVGVSGRVARAVAPAGAFALAVGTGLAQAASTPAQQAVDTVLTLAGIGLLLWIVGNILAKHNYDTGGPKGEKLPPAQ